MPAVAGRVRDMTTRICSGPRWRCRGCRVHAGCAQAHPSFETRSAAVGSSYKAVIKVPHGCDGSPTTRVRVLIPEGVIGVKPKPMPGWSIETKRGPYARSYKFYHGAVLTEGVKEIVWSGKLPDDYYDEFVFSAFLTDSLAAGTTLHFPVYQDCEKGAHAWADVPAPGQDAHALKSPAPGIALLPVADKRPNRANLQGRHAGDRGAVGARNAGRRAGRRRLHEDHQHRQGSRSAGRRVAADCGRGRGA